MGETNKILSEIRAYLRISAAAASRISAARTLDTYEKALVYSKLDGKTSQRWMEQATGVPQRTIGNWLATFVQAGLASPPDEYNDSHRALFTLQELGIEVTALKKRAKEAKPSLETATSQIVPSEAQQSVIQKYQGEEKSGTAE